MAGHYEGRKSFIRHRTPVVRRNARVVWLSFRFLVEERPARGNYIKQKYQEIRSRSLLLLFSTEIMVRAGYRLLALIPGAPPQTLPSRSEDIRKRGNLRLALVQPSCTVSQDRSRNNYCGRYDIGNFLY